VEGKEGKQKGKIKNVAKGWLFIALFVAFSSPFSYTRFQHSRFDLFFFLYRHSSKCNDE
jgi:hypothetical protein